MAKSEEDCGNWSCLCKFIKCLFLQELFDLFFILFVNHSCIVLGHWDTQMCVNETWTEGLSIITAFSLFILFFCLVEVCLPINWGKVNLEEKVKHVRVSPVRIAYIRSTRINECFLLNWYHVAHIYANLESFQLIRKSLVFLTICGGIKENTRLANLKLSLDLAVLCAIIDCKIFDYFIISHKERKLPQVLLRC